MDLVHLGADGNPPGPYPDLIGASAGRSATPAQREQLATDGKPTTVPPQNLEAEESVLGAMMVSESAIDPVLLDVRLRAEDFYRDQHRTIYAAILGLHENTDPSTSSRSPRRSRSAASSTRSAAATSSPASRPRSPPPGNARHYAQIVKQNSLLRRLLGAAQRIQHRSRPRGRAAALVENAERLLFEVAHEEQAGDFREIDEILHEEIDKLEKLASGDVRDHRHPIRLPGPRRHHRRLPARQPDRDRRAAGDGKRASSATSPRTSR